MFSGREKTAQHTRRMLRFKRQQCVLLGEVCVNGQEVRRSSVVFRNARHGGRERKRRAHGAYLGRSESICLVDKGGSMDGTYITLLHHIKMND